MAIKNEIEISYEMKEAKFIYRFYQNEPGLFYKA